MLDVSYSYYGDTIRCVSKLKGFEVQWDKGLFTNYLTNTHHSNTQTLDAVIFDLPAEVQFKIIGDLLKSDPIEAFKLIFRYNYQTLFRLSSTLFSLFVVFMICQLFITLCGNILH